MCIRGDDICFEDHNNGGRRNYFDNNATWKIEGCCDKVTFYDDDENDNDDDDRGCDLFMIEVLLDDLCWSWY